MMTGRTAQAARSDCEAVSIGETITTQMRTKLISGGYAPGSSLSDAQIAMHFKCSRMPARDALRTMETEGYLKRDGRRLIVPDQALPVSEELFAVRAALESELAGFAAVRITPAELADMQQQQKQLHAHSGEDGDIALFLEALLALEQAMWKTARMNLIAQEAARWQARTRALVRQIIMCPALRKDISIQQRYLISALAARDPIWARQMVSVSLRAMFQQFEASKHTVERDDQGNLEQ
jgi:DNA-binding GntR family transcriptional regulator